MDNTSNLSLQELKVSLIQDLKNRVDDKILEESNFLLLEKLINNASDKTEAIAIAELGTTYKRTGFHFDKKLERLGTNIKYLKRNDALSFSSVNDSDLTHKLIIGDNYDALLNLSISHKGKIDVIYIDPPYGKDDMGEFAETNYNNAITRDNLLSMLYPRLILAKQLLSEEGVIFCSIDDKNQAYVKCLFDDVFGEKNYVDTLHWKRKKQPSFLAKHTAKVMEYVLIYAKKSELLEKLSIDTISDDTKKVINLSNQESIRHFETGVRVKCGENGFIPKGIYKIKTMYVEYLNDVYFKNGLTENEIDVRAKFSVSQEKIDTFIKDKLLFITKNYGLRRDTSIDEKSKAKSITDLLLDWGDNQDSEKEIEDIFGNKYFDYSKPTKLIKNLIKSTTKVDGIVLDFFAGSGTTGHAVLELNKEDGGNRTFILCTNNEITEKNPNGIAYDVTSKRLKRVMTGKCYDGTDDFEWIKKNEALGGNLEVMEIAEVSNIEQQEGLSAFDVINEKLYGQDFTLSVEDKIRWVCENFSVTQKYLAEPKSEV